jgi:predicted DCC family thiol-disulfide oxidoreductase YuxK
MEPHDTGSTPTPKPLVLFDGACPLCSREIAHYRGLRWADKIEWRDISDAQTLLPDGIEHSAAMARFHVRDTAGVWHTGAQGFVELWRHLPGYRHLGWLLRRLRLVGLMDRAYAHWARWRAARECSPGICTPDRTAGSRISDQRAGDRGDMS